MYDTGKKGSADKTKADFRGLAGSSEKIKGEMLGIEFSNTIGFNNGFRQISRANYKFRKQFTNISIKFLGGWNFGIHELYLEQYGTIHSLRYPFFSYNVKFDLTGRKCDLWQNNKLTACNN